MFVEEMERGVTGEGDWVARSVMDELVTGALDACCFVVRLIALRKTR